MSLNRAYSLLEVKSLDAEERVIEGIASTPAPDRLDDIVEPLGAVFKLPMPLLWQHNHDEPIGHVEFAAPTKKGIPFKARLVKIADPGPLRDRLETAWQSIKSKLVTGISIGFRPLKDGIEHLEGGGLRFTAWEWLETSVVTLPAQAQASITAIKRLDTASRFAQGERRGVVHLRPPGASGTTNPKPKPPEGQTMNLQEQITSFETKRQADAERMNAIMEKAADEGRTLDEAETEEYDGLEVEIKSIDDHLKRLRVLEKANIAKAVPATPATTQGGEKAASLRGGTISVQRNLPKGTAFTRYAIALAAGRGSIADALRHAERWRDSTPEVEQYIKATAGTTTDADWAAPLIDQSNLAAEFIELLRPETIVGRIAGIRRVPFNVKIPVQSGGSTVGWVGEAAAKPVSDLAFTNITLAYNKVAGIVVLSDELIRLSTPSAEAVVRQDLTAQIAQFMDAQFIDPAVTASAGVRPASITNGVTPITASGADSEALYYDISQAFAPFIAANLGVSGAVWIMPPALALGISLLRNALGQFEFGGMSVTGGSLVGLPVIVSDSVPAGTIVLLKANEVLMADDGAVMLDASREATLDLAGGDTPTFNLWQKNCTAIRCERWVTWAKRRPEAVALIDTAAYGPAAPAP